MAEQETQGAGTDSAAASAHNPDLPVPSLEELQHWTWVMGRAQQMMMEHLAEQWGQAASQAVDPAKFAASWPAMNWFADPAKVAQAQADLWSEGLAIWQRALGAHSGQPELEAKADQDKRFNAPQWRDNPLFDMIRQLALAWLRVVLRDRVGVAMG